MIVNVSFATLSFDIAAITFVGKTGFYRWKQKMQPLLGCRWEPRKWEVVVGFACRTRGL